MEDEPIVFIAAYEAFTHLRLNFLIFNAILILFIF